MARALWSNWCWLELAKIANWIELNWRFLWSKNAPRKFWARTLLCRTSRCFASRIEKLYLQLGEQSRLEEWDYYWSQPPRVMLRNSNIRQQVAQPFICWRCLARPYQTSSHGQRRKGSRARATSLEVERCRWRTSRRSFSGSPAVSVRLLVLEGRANGS